MVPDQISGSTPSNGPALPQHLVGQGEIGRPQNVHGIRKANHGAWAVHDEGLKNLLMAWYYAGYYTGLHEGKQQGAAGKGE